MLGFHGDFAINALSGNIYWKNGTRWITVFTLLEGKADDITIYTRSLEAPLRPMGDVNIGWADSFSSLNLINKHVWESKAKYIGSVRISEWSVPVIKIFGKIEKQETEVLTSHTIYIVSKNRPPIKARVDDPTIDTGWVNIYPGVKKLDDVIWESSTVKNQHGKIKRPWSTPRKVAVRDGEKGEPGKKLLLEYNEVENKFVQRYEGESETTDLATRETIVGTELIQLPGRVSQAETELSNKLNASDIADWAKEPAKPTYTASEVGARPESWKPSWLDVENKPAVIIEGDSRLTDSRPASDVPAWAKEPAKPSYTASEVGARPESWKPSWLDVENKPDVVIEGDSRLTDSRPASDVPEWAKEPAKPTYTASEVGARPESWKPSWLDVENKPDVIIEGDSRLTDSRPASDVPAWAKKQSLDSADLPEIPLENMIVSWTDIAGDTIVDDIGIAVDSMVPKSWIGIESGQIRRNFQNNDHYLQRSFNLNDLPNKATARSNLGLGTMALQNVENYSTTTQANVLYVGKSTNETISGVKTFGGANTAFSNGITLGSIVNIRPLNIRQNSDSDDVARILCWKTSGDAYLRFRFTSSDGGLDTFSTMLGASRRSASDYRTVLGSATSSSNASIKASLAGNGTFHVAGDVVAFSNNV